MRSIPLNDHVKQSLASVLAQACISQYYKAGDKFVEENTGTVEKDMAFVGYHLDNLKYPTNEWRTMARLLLWSSG